MERTLIGKELLDLPGSATREEIRGNLRDIAFANRWFGGTSVVLRHLRKMLGDADTVTVLDLATGLGDIPMAIVRWARRRGIAVKITAVDNNPTVVELAREHARAFPEITIEQRSILDLPYEDASFDFVTSSQTIHHLSNQEVEQVLRSANRLAAKGIIISDLRRRPFCRYLAGTASMLMANRLTRHDGRLSFKNAFTPEEIEELADKAGLSNYRVHLHGPCRLSLVVKTLHHGGTEDTEKGFLGVIPSP